MLRTAVLLAPETDQPIEAVIGQATILSAARIAWRMGDCLLHHAAQWCTLPLLIGTLQDQMNIEVVQSSPAPEVFGMLPQGKVNGMHKNGDLQRHWTAFQSQEYNVVEVSHAINSLSRASCCHYTLCTTSVGGRASPENSDMSRLSVQSSQLLSHVRSCLLCADWVSMQWQQCAQSLAVDSTSHAAVC